MSISEMSTDRSEKVLAISRSAWLLRLTIIVLIVFAIVVLIVCEFVAPIFGQNNQQTSGLRQDLSYNVGGGKYETLGDFPWHASIYVPIGYELHLTCGGTIIDKNTILTAAHCLFVGDHRLTAKQVSVHAGLIDLREISPVRQTFTVSKIIIHPEFINHLHENDIAIIKLASDIVFTPYVRPVCLLDDDQSQIVGKNGTIVGFGYNKYGQQSQFLQKATLTVVDNQDCLEQDRLSYGLVLTRNMFCAGGEPGVSACNGDSGGGMVFYTEETWYIIGIVSFIAHIPNNGSCDSSKYTVFTDVRKYRSWILQYIDQSSIVVENYEPIPQSTSRPLTTAGKYSKTISQSTTTRKPSNNVTKFRKTTSSSIVVPKRKTNLKPCNDSIIREDTRCNGAHRFEHGFFLVSEYYNIIRVPLDGGRGFKIASATLAELNHDCAGGRVYWSDYEGGRILSANYDGTERRSFITKNIGLPQSVAVDWISRRLYWADKEKKTIEVASLENPNLRTVLITDDLVDPRGVVVDPFKTKLYWSDWNNGDQNIEWSNLDGSDRKILVSGEEIKNMRSFHVFTATGEFCFTDHATKQIECLNPFTNETRTVAKTTTEPLGLSATDERFYWTDLETKQIKSTNLDGEAQDPISSPIIQSQMYEMTIVTDECPIFYNPCAVENGECPENTICLLNALADKGRSCKLIGS